MSNPRKGSYGYTIRIDCGVDMSQFSNVTLYCSSSAGGDGFTLTTNASTLFVGNSTIYSSTEGLTFNSGEWVYGQNLTANAFATADTWNVYVVGSATAKNFISPVVSFTVDD